LVKRILVWDIPTRLLHWVVALGFVAALAIGELADDDGPLFVVHMALGLIIAVAVLLRCVGAQLRIPAYSCRVVADPGVR